MHPSLLFFEVGILTILSFFCALICLFFAIESFMEYEPRASRIGLVAAMFFIALGVAASFFPSVRFLAATLFIAIGVLCLLVLIPSSANSSALKGAIGSAVGKPKRFDERDTVFARNRSLPEGSEIYQKYYAAHPDRKGADSERRKKGGPVGRVGAIDNEHPLNVAMIDACFQMPPIFGIHAHANPNPDIPRLSLDPKRGAAVVKGFARHLGADLVGICRVNPDWAYSHRGEIFYGNRDDWGKEIEPPFPVAVVIATEMSAEFVGAGPHTPALLESSKNYAKGAFITTVLSRWFAAMGYRASAQHSRHYDLNLVPLAIDAGLGELGRFGYLITGKFGPRVRLFAVTTDMPLFPDSPIDLGVDAFCRRCLKCADACPSKSIPFGGKSISNGIRKWKLDAESCFNYWGKVGTDCSVCMGICPFSRPDRPIHRLARRLIRRSRPAQNILPYLDNFIYGRKWNVRPVPGWVDYRI